MKIFIISLLIIKTFQNYNNNANITMTDEELFKIMNTGTKIKFASEANLKMTQLSNRAMKNTCRNEHWI